MQLKTTLLFHLFGSYSLMLIYFLRKICIILQIIFTYVYGWVNIIVLVWVGIPLFGFQGGWVGEYLQSSGYVHFNTTINICLVYIFILLMNTLKYTKVEFIQYQLLSIVPSYLKYTTRYLFQHKATVNSIDLF